MTTAGTEMPAAEQLLSAGAKCGFFAIPTPELCHEEDSEGKQIGADKDFRRQAEAQQRFGVAAAAGIAPVVVGDEPQPDQSENP